MSFLVDNPLDATLATMLDDAGHDAVHVVALGLAREPDEVLFERAAAGQRVVVSADTDFGTLLALTSARSPSVILLRRGTPRRGAPVAALLARVLPDVEAALAAGAIVVIGGACSTRMSRRRLASTRWARSWAAFRRRKREFIARAPRRDLRSPRERQAPRERHRQRVWRTSCAPERRCRT